MTCPSRLPRRRRFAPIALCVFAPLAAAYSGPPVVGRFAMLARASSTSAGEESLADRLAQADSACGARGADDEDDDGLGDACEQELAERFAPIVYHSSDESNYPTSVDRFLSQSALFFFDDGCAPDLKVEMLRAPRQAQLLGHDVDGTCGGGESVTSGGTRSVHKSRTFFLRDVSKEARRGSSDSREWSTYVHAYPNDLGGVTLQYWRFYAYNDALNDHGGDWEGLHVVLDAARRPSRVRLLAHSGMRDVEARDLDWEGSHPRVFSEGGGHATRRSPEGIRARDCELREPCMLDPDVRETFIRQEAWSGGRVLWPSGAVTPSGRLINVGEKRAPLNGQFFIQYSGLWGSPGFLYGTSGYWGPAYNETEMRRDGFLSAWCAGMKSEALAEECWPAQRSR